MKKVLVSLLVLALAMTSAFAAVDFTGEVVAGYTFQYHNDAWNYHTMGQDGVDTAPIKINAKVADENGYWDITMKGALIADNRLGGNINVDLGKIIMGADISLFDDYVQSWYSLGGQQITDEVNEWYSER